MSSRNCCKPHFPSADSSVSTHSSTAKASGFASPKIAIVNRDTIFQHHELLGFVSKLTCTCCHYTKNITTYKPQHAGPRAHWQGGRAPLNFSPSSAAAKPVALPLQLFCFELCISRCSFLFLLGDRGSNKAELSAASMHTAAQRSSSAAAAAEEHVCLCWNKCTQMLVGAFFANVPCSKDETLPGGWVLCFFTVLHGDTQIRNPSCPFGLPRFVQC